MCLTIILLAPRSISALCIVAAVAVTTAVAAAVVTTTGIEPVQNTTTASSSIISTCGVVNGEFKKGRFGFVLEDIERQFGTREIRLVENIIVDAYNNVTRGLSGAGCKDKFLREMQNSTLLRQDFTPENYVLEVPEPSQLELTFDAWVLCDG